MNDSQNKWGSANDSSPQQQQKKPMTLHDLAKQVADSWTNVPRYSRIESAIAMVADCLVELCTGAPGWPPAKQLVWLNDQVKWWRNWEEKGGLAAVREMFEKQFPPERAEALHAASSAAPRSFSSASTAITGDFFAMRTLTSGVTAVWRTTQSA
jgi:hypothetical protein